MNTMKMISMVIMLMAIVIIIILTIGEAEACAIMYNRRNADDGETPVVIYLEGSTWNIEESICYSNLYCGMNMIGFCSRTDSYNFSGFWKQDDIDRMADEIVGIVLSAFPKTKKVVNVSFSNGGYMADALYRRCRENGIETLCVVSLDSWPERWGFRDIETGGQPMMICLSQTNIWNHITGNTREYAMSAKATVKEYPVTHGALETDKAVHNDVYEFIRGVMQ